jgi:oligopeptidase B
MLDAPGKVIARSARAPAPPVARREPRAHSAHGVSWTDEYDWIRAANWQQVLREPAATPADIAKLLKAENRYCKAVLAETVALQKTLIAEMRGRIKEDDVAPPRHDGQWSYYSRYARRAEHPLICRKPRDGGREQKLIDANALARGKDFFDLGDTDHSPDHKLLAWSADEQGSELHTIRVRDLATGEDLPDQVFETTGAVVWAADSRAFYYVRVDANHRPSSVWRRRLGDDPSADTLIFREHEGDQFVSISETQSGAYLIIDVSDHDSAEIWLADLADPIAEARLVAARRPGVRYDLDHHDERLIILTNADGAEDFRIVAAPVRTPGPEHWTDLIPHVPGRMIVSHACLKGRLVRLEREESLPRIVIHDLATGHEKAIAFDEEAYGLGMDAGLEFDTDWLRYTYASMARPAETWDYNMATGERVLVKRQEIPSGHDQSRYVVRRIFAEAKDGERVPVSILHRADMALDGSAPCLLYGYGSYGSAMSASFRVRPLSLVDRGFVYAIAHVRGGTEKGWRWYETGKKQHKVNTFTDFIAAAEALIAQGFTRSGRIVAEGGSAGGMLMGAVANMRPDLFAGIIADVPFVDVVHTIMDASLPLTPPEWKEWGDPINDPQAFATIRGYSPYDNVSAQSYPPILAIAGLTDPRVTYWEPAKWVQRLRARMTGGGPILLSTNMTAGHAGASGRFDSLKETGLAYAFALTCVAGFPKGGAGS